MKGEAAIAVERLRVRKPSESVSVGCGVGILYEWFEDGPYIDPNFKREWGRFGLEGRQQQVRNLASRPSPIGILVEVAASSSRNFAGLIHYPPTQPEGFAPVELDTASDCLS